MSAARLRARVGWRLVCVVVAALWLVYVSLWHVGWLLVKLSACLLVMGLTVWVLYAGVSFGH